MKSNELGKQVNTDTKRLFELLGRFDYERIKEYFDTVYGSGDNLRFDFEMGLLCGTIENDGGRPMLVDLQFTQRHLI